MSLRHYLLRFAACHLRWAHESQPLWTLLSNPDYQTAQTTAFKGFVGAAVSSLREGIEVYAQRDEQTEDDDARLCWLALRCGEVVQEARNNLHQLFQGFQADCVDAQTRVEDALQQLAVVDEATFLGAGLLLLHIGAQPRRPGEGSLSNEHFQQIIDAMKRRVPAQIDGGEEYLNAWLAGQLSLRLPMEIWRDLNFFPRQADTWRKEAALTLLDHDRWDDAAAIARQIEGPRNQALTIIAVAKKLIQLGREPEALRLLSNTLLKAQGMERQSFEADDASDAKPSVQARRKTDAFQLLVNQSVGQPFESYSSETYDASDAIAEALGLLKHIEETRDLILQLIAHAKSLRLPSRQASSLAAIAVALHGVGQEEWAVTVFGHALEAMDRIETDSEIVQMLGTVIEPAIRVAQDQERLAMATRVIEVCGKLKEPGERAKGLAMVASALARIDEKKWAQELLAQATAALKESREPGTMSAASASIAALLAQLGDHDSALQMADGIPGALDQAEAFGAIAASFVLAGQQERAMQVAGRSKVGSYAAIPHVMFVAALMETGRVDKALLELANISDNHDRAYLVNAITSRADRATVGMYEGCRWRCPTINATSLAAVTLPELLRGASQIKQPREKFQVLAAIARCLQKSQQNHAQSEVLKEAVSACIDVLEASQQLDVNAYACEAINQVCAALVDTKRYGEAQSVAAVIQNPLERANMLLSLATAAAADGDVVRTLGAAEQADRVTNQLLQPCERIRLFCTAGSVMITIKETERAMQFLNHAIEEAGKLPSEDQPYGTLQAPNIDQSESFGIIAVTLAKAGDGQRAMSIADRIPNTSHREAVMESMIKVLIADGNYEAAGEVVLRMQQSCGPSAPGKAWSAAVHARAGQANLASQLFSEALLFAQKKPAAPPWTIMRSLVAVTEALVEAGEFGNRAAFLGTLMNLAAQIRHYPSRGEALIKIVQSLQVVDTLEARMGLFLQALDAAATIKEDHWQTQVLTAIARALTGVAHSAEFALGMRRLVELAQGIAKARCQVEPLASAAATLAQTGHLPWANRLFEVAITISEKIEDQLDRQQAIATTAAQIAHGDDPEQLRSNFNRLLNLALSIQDFGRRSNSLRVVLQASFKAEARLTAQLLDDLESLALPTESLGWIVGFSRAVSQTGEIGLPLIRKATILSARRLDLTLSLATGMVAAYTRSDRRHRAKEIVRQCPQLGLAEILK